MPVDQSDIFDAKYTANESLPVSDEYTDESQRGVYGWSEHDRAILQSVDPRCIWTMIDGDGGVYMASGMHFVNRIYYFVSNEPCEQEFEEYCVHVDNDDEDSVEEDGGDGMQNERSFNPDEDGYVVEPDGGNLF